MRRGLLSVLGLVLVGAWVSDCGPPPVPLTGSVHYNTGCRMTATNPNCATSEVFIDAQTNGSGHVVSCAVTPAAAGGARRIRFAIGNSTTGVITDGEGINLCGEVAGPNTDMSNTSVSLYFPTQANTMAPGGCQVHINNVGDDSFDGWISCTDVVTGAGAQLRYIGGIQGGDHPTSDPMHADFSFVSCTTLATSCPR